MADDITHNEGPEAEYVGFETEELAAIVEHDRALLAGIAVRRRWALVSLVATSAVFVLVAGYVVAEWARAYGPDRAIFPALAISSAAIMAVSSGWIYGLFWTQGRLMPLIVRQFKAFRILEHVAFTELEARKREHNAISSETSAINETYARVLEELRRARAENALIDRSLFGHFEPKRSGRRPYLANEWARAEVSHGVKKSALRSEWQARIWAEMQQMGITQQPADWDDTFRKVFSSSGGRKK